ncbi:MAG: DUF2442 domain-containing protein [Rhodocyclaceae bacterium]|nr:DUF2442 domain-containing protein [Rhodocyclaceae bacterium]
MFLIDVTQVCPLENRKLELTFADGVHAVVDMNHVITSYTGIFAALTDDDYFRQVRVASELGTVVWPNGADICPDVLYSFASGKPIIINGERMLN